MKVEKISDSQIKIILSQTDLRERDIQLTELAMGSEKIHQLFHDMMEQALIELNFITENTPLMVEAIPTSSESIMLIITKIKGDKDATEERSVIQRRFRESKKVKPAPQSSDYLSIYMFDSLDDATLAAGRLHEFFCGESSLYKSTGKYYLFLFTADHDAAMSADFEAILSEYGQKHLSTPLSRQYLADRAETIIAEDAVGKLAMIARC
ncbi:MAG: adaptor protein MecA [Defluviitaleaceae bacterium]|nr:adaptor protein MecA [Defluviitaleaceae bacterium]